MEALKQGCEDMDIEEEPLPSPPTERKRKSLAPGGDLLPVLEKVDDGLDGVAPIPKKKRKEDSEAIDAETQRLLRESKKVAFPEGRLEQKPISSVLEKMRQRKLERAQRGRPSHQGLEGCSKRLAINLKKALNDDNALDLDHDIEVVMVKPPTQPVLVVKHEDCGPSTSTKHQAVQKTSTSDESIGGNRPSTPETQSESSRTDLSSVIPRRRETLMRPPLIDSQDLYSDSQLSPPRDEVLVLTNVDDDVAPSELREIAQLGYEAQDEDSRSLAEDEEKENKDPKSGTIPEGFPNISHVRGLIDDEAEDEDEDLLDDEEDEDEDAAEDLRDLLTQDVIEKAADNERRANLHRKWLEQQDATMTDSILQRIESGWKGKVKKQRLPGILNEAKGNDSEESKSRSVPEILQKPSETSSFDFPSSFVRNGEQPKDLEAKRARSLDVPEIVENVDTQEFIDEEEDEQFRRQRMLSESEEMSELPSVHDDETSRQIFSLINKVNVATIKTTKVNSGATDIRPAGVVHHHSLSLVQSSFVRRTVTTSVQTTTRQGSGSSRSYIFGRDDSNSNHGSRFQDHEAKTGNDLSAPVGDNATSNSKVQSTSRGSSRKGIEAKAVEPTGPSLFQILKQQAADLEKSVQARDSSFNLNGSSSRSGDLSIFSVMKPSKPSRKSRG